jgi:Ca-activated chloride channel homolog
MSFAHPWVLLLLGLPLALIARLWQRGGGRVVLPFDHHPHRGGRWLRVAIDSAETLLPLLAAIGIVIAAGPTRTGEPKSRRILTNIEFCVDVSGSMTAPCGEGTRYDASMAAIDRFLGARAGDAFGLTFFGSSVLHWAPLTTDPSALRCAVPFMKPGNLPIWFGGTEIGKALLACAEVLDARPEGDRAIVLVSDGMSFDLNGDNEARVAKTLQDKRIALWAIHVAETEIPSEIIDLAAATGGAAFHADDPGTLTDVFGRIDAMQKTKLAKTAAETVDFFAPFSIAGLSLLGLATLCSFGVRYTPW